MNKPAIKSEKNLTGVLPENKAETDDEPGTGDALETVAHLSQKISVNPVHSDLIWLGRCPLIDSQN